MESQIEGLLPMNRYQVLGFVALLVVVVALPIYALQESRRMDRAQVIMGRQFVAEGSTLYVDNCANCHGAGGEGFGAMPALNNPNLVNADYDLLYQTIAHAPHGTIMSAWHIDEGGSLSSYEVEGLVTLIMTADWSQVAQLAAANGFVAPTPSVPEIELATMEGMGTDPHECRACHEEPAVHADRFGLNCSRCHTLQAWKPALLTRHTFLLDHGGNGRVACQTCHTVNYREHSCYECHDHDPGQMQAAHLQEGIADLGQCAECHPTGASGEAASLGYGRSAQAESKEVAAGGGDNLAGVSAMLGRDANGQSAGREAGDSRGIKADAVENSAGTGDAAQPGSEEQPGGDSTGQSRAGEEPGNHAGNADTSQSNGPERGGGK